TVTSIDSIKKQVATNSGRVESYDELILATGSFPFILPIPGSDKKGVTAFRDIKDTEDIWGRSTGRSKRKRRQVK
ncbi:hypothetical protein COE35_19675, partial [Priestia megaterium]